MRSELAASLRRLSRHCALFAAMYVILSPLWLGEAIVPLARALGTFEHVCACGMAPGACGCPACARLEREKQGERGPGPVLRSACDTDDDVLPQAPLPACLLPALVAMRDPLAHDSLPLPAAGSPQHRLSDGPPTPPPRLGRL